MRPEAIAAWATGVGVGLIVLMLVWLIGNRIAAVFWGPPVGPVVALIGAIVTGAAAALVSGVRLARTARAER